MNPIVFAMRRLVTMLVVALLLGGLPAQDEDMRGILTFLDPR